MIKFGLKGILVAIALLTIISMNSCKKAKDTKVKITIVNAANDPLSGATVQLFGNPSVPNTSEVRINEKGTTDIRGTIEFDLTPYHQRGQVGFGVLDVYAEYASENPAITVIASGVIKIDEEVVNEKTFIAE